MINMRLLCTQRLDRIKMLFWWMGMKSTMINSHHPRTNQAIEVILTVQYINMGRAWNRIDHRRSEGCQRDSMKLDGMNG